MAHSIVSWLLDEELLKQLMTGLPAYLLVVIIAASIAVLVKGANWMIDGVVDLAQRTGLPRIVIGATIVSLGTTTPEAFVSVMAAFMGNPGLALGNGVGSIIADTGLIFGLICVLSRVPIQRYILNRTGWVQVAAATLLVAIALLARWTTPAAPVLSRWVGLFFLLLLSLYLYITYRWARQGGAQLLDERQSSAEDLRTLPMCWFMLCGGLVLVIVAARVLIPGASEIAYRLGVPEDVIAASLVALGTSLPELITAIAAVRKGHPEIAVGNIVGADVLNCLFVIGAAAFASPLAIPENFYHFHFPAMLLILYSFRIFISASRKDQFSRWQGAWLLCVYTAYVIRQYI